MQIYSEVGDVARCGGKHDDKRPGDLHRPTLGDGLHGTDGGASHLHHQHLEPERRAPLVGAGAQRNMALFSQLNFAGDGADVLSFVRRHGDLDDRLGHGPTDTQGWFDLAADLRLVARVWDQADGGGTSHVVVSAAHRHQADDVLRSTLLPTTARAADVIVDPHNMGAPEHQKRPPRLNASTRRRWPRGRASPAVAASPSSWRPRRSASIGTR